MRRFYNYVFGSQKGQSITVLLLLSFFFLLGLLSAPSVTLTMDESLHHQYGTRVAQGNVSRFDDSKMPVSALNVLPGELARFLPDGALKALLEKFLVARMVTILFSTLVGWLVFHWTRALFGFPSALFCLLLYVFDPNIIAHSQLVTTDVYAMGFTLFTFYRLWIFARQRTIQNGLFFFVVLGASQLVKYTSVVFYPLCFIALLLHDLPTLLNGTIRITTFVKNYLIYLSAGIVISIFVINIGFLFTRTFTPLGEYQFRSSFFANLQTPMLSNLPVPTPYAYLEGLDWMRDTEQSGKRFGNVYLLGQLSKPKGFLGYYMVASLLKVPIATQVIILTAFILYFSRKEWEKSWREDAFFIIPTLFFFLYFNFFFSAQTGIRYYMIFFPLIYVFSGRVFFGWREFSRLKKGLVFGLFGYLLLSVLSYYPYYIPYFNEFVWDKTQTYKYLSDSNLDWDQGGVALQQYMNQHPDTVFKPDHIQAGRLVVGGSDLVGILEDPEKYAWLRNHFQPDETIGYSYFVYYITPEEIETICATSDACK